MAIFTLGNYSPVTFSLGAYQTGVTEEIDALSHHDAVARFWKSDPLLWSNDYDVHLQISNSLGWIEVAGLMKERLTELTDFAEEVRGLGFEKVVLLGMGGSSLAPEVLRASLPTKAEHPALMVLDSTDPDAVSFIKDNIDPAKSLFIFASKSGSTIEPLSFFDYFFALVDEIKPGSAGENFVAITDPGSPLEALAGERNFLRTFLNPSDIGGRYSALSYFGLVPAALAGMDVSALIDGALKMADQCGTDVPVKENPAFYLGFALAALAKLGRDKITFLISEEYEALGLWLEQLIAESTGKERRGLVPIADEPFGDIERYGSDRVFVHIGSPFVDEHHIELFHYLEEAGHPVLSLRIDDPSDLGGEFLRWEIATAAAGLALGINPFDQPDVESAKAAARLLLRDQGGDQSDYLPEGRKFDGEGFSLYLPTTVLTKMAFKPSAGTSGADLADAALKGFFGLADPDDYIGLLAYFNPFEAGLVNRFSALRQLIRDSLGTATQLGFGPRYLHSTGQLHKGGADNGIFFIFYHNAPGASDVDIPGRDFSFLTLEKSQALGDLGALHKKGRRVALVGLDAPFAASVDNIRSFFQSTLTGLERP